MDEKKMNKIQALDDDNLENVAGGYVEATKLTNLVTLYNVYDNETHEFLGYTAGVGEAGNREARAEASKFDQQYHSQKNSQQ